MTIYTTASAVPGSYALPISATAGGSQQFATVTLNVTPTLKPREVQTQNGVTMLSQITVYSSPPSSRYIEVQAETMVDYQFAAVYYAEVDSSLYKDGNPYPCSNPSPVNYGTTIATALFCGSTSSPTVLDASDGSDYTLVSEHYVDIINVFLSFTASPYVPAYDDYYGFSSLLPTNDVTDTSANTGAMKLLFEASTGLRRPSISAPQQFNCTVLSPEIVTPEDGP